MVSEYGYESCFIFKILFSPVSFVDKIIIDYDSSF